VDVVVVGAGLMGAATAWAASRRGLSVVVLEQFAPGHDRGSSHGSARIVRRAYGDPLYTRISGPAFALWDEVSEESGAVLLRLLGGLDFGGGREVATVAENLARCGVAHEVLDAAEAETRWPGMRFAGPVVYHPQAGTLDAARAVTALLELAGRRGAELRHETRAVRLEPDADHATVHVAGGPPISAGAVVVAAGAWVAGLLGGLVPLPPLQVREQQVFHFPRLEVAAAPWPCVIHEPGDHVPVYHLAGGRDGGAGDDRKIGEHGLGRPVDPDRAERGIDPAARARMVEYVKRWLPGLDPVPRAETTCLYTNTPNEDFVVDRLGPLVVCSPCSGHGAKFAPLVGEWCAGLVTGAADVPDRFRLDTHALPATGQVSL
jgi:sarcosine oxidase